MSSCGEPQHTVSISGYLCMFLVVGLVFVPTNGDNTCTQAKQTEIARLNKLFEDYAVANDTVAMSEMFHPEAMYYPMGKELVRGREAIEERLHDWIGFTYSITDTNSEILPLSSRYILDSEMRKGYGASSTVNFDGKCVIIWKETEDEWKIFSYICNKNN